MVSASGGPPTEPLTRQLDRLARSAEAIDRAQLHAGAQLRTVSQGFYEVATALHQQARELERAVEGVFAADASDPRTRLLAETLHLSRRADLRLAQLSHSLNEAIQTITAARDESVALQQERAHLGTLVTVAHTLNSTLEFDRVLDLVMDQLVQVMRAERGFLMLYDPDADTLQFSIARNLDHQAISAPDFSISHQVVERVWATQLPLLTTNAQEDTRLSGSASIFTYGIRSILCAPLRVRDRGIGVVYVDSRTTANLFHECDLDLLTAFCDQAAITIENARLYTAVRAHLRAISEMQTYMENVFSSISSGVMTTDTAERIVSANRAALRLFALLPEVINRPIDEVFAGIQGVDLATLMRQAAQRDETIVGYEADCRLPDGTERYVSLGIAALRNAAQERLGQVLIVEDLTELRRSQRRAEHIQRIFGQYVHHTVVEQLINDPGALHLGGETRVVTIIFADIRDFTRLGEMASPQELVNLLNDYLGVLTQAIWEEKGTLTMFIGDALMAIFNAPLPQPDHALRGVRAAWAMRQAIEQYQATHGTAVPPVAYGIGVNTGPAVVGNIGARERLQNYTAIGDAVNIAARLQTSASANQILLSATTYDLARDAINARPLAPLALKNKLEPVQAYELLGLCR
jgi:adenylate cyclase